MFSRVLRTASGIAVFCLATATHEPSHGGAEEGLAPDAGAALDAVLKEFIAGHYDRVPTAAVNSGLHEYDGRLPDFTPEGIRERVGWLEQMRERAAAMDTSAVDARQRLYRDYLLVEIDTQLFNIRTLRVLENNAWYDYLALDPNVYLSRNYAPLEQRMDAYVRHVEALPRATAAMKRTLQPMPSGHAEAMHDYLAGLATFVATVPYEVFAPVDDPARQSAMKQANERAAAALTGLVQWVDAMPRNEAFALGSHGYVQMLWALERIDTSPAELRTIVERDHERNMQSLGRACAAFAPGTTVRECRARVAARKPPEVRSRPRNARSIA